MSEFPEFSKICLHKHLGGRGADKELDQPFNKKTSFDLDYAKTQIDEASKLKYDIVAFTNKGNFDKTNYILLKKYSLLKGINLLPGVEINLLSKDMQKSLHVTIVFDSSEKVLSTLETKIDLISQNNKRNAFVIEDLVDLVMIDKCIIYPHGLKQSQRSSKENPEQFLELIDMLHSIPITMDDSKAYKKDILLNSLKSKLSEDNYDFLKDVTGVATSADRQPFLDVKDPSFIWGPATFDSLYFASIMGNKRIFFKKDIVIKGRYISKIIISRINGEKSSLVSSTIICSHGLNSIIGESGSGKTLLLNLICKKLKGEDLSMPASSQTSDYEELYSGSEVKIFDQYDHEIHSGDIHVFEGENLYRTIISTYSSDKNALLDKLDASPKFTDFNRLISQFNQGITSFVASLTSIYTLKKNIDSCLKQSLSSEEYLKNNKTNSDNIQFVLTNTSRTELDSLNEKQETIQNDLDLFESSNQLFDKLVSRYCIDNAFKAMKSHNAYASLLKLSIQKSLAETKREILVKEQSISNEEKINQFVNEYNVFGGQTLIQLGKARSTIENNINQIVSDLEKIAFEMLNTFEPSLRKEDLVQSLKVGSNNSDVKLSDVIFKNILSYDEFPGFFGDFMGSSSNKIKKTSFKSVLKTGNDKIDIFDFETYKEFFAIIVSSNMFFGTFFSPNIDDFISYNIEIRNGGQFVNINTLSAGQLSKIYIGKLIDKGLDLTGQGSIVLYDQPDNNLEKPFILETLGDWISKTKLIHQVFITTHEPLLVVNADSNQIIRAKNAKTIGSKAQISFSTLSFINETTEEGVVKKIANLIDGSTEAIELRDDIYRGMEHGNK